MPDVVLRQLATEDVTVEPRSPRIVTQYWAKGSTDLADVLLALRRQDAAPAGTVRVPPILRGLPLVQFNPRYLGAKLWTVDVTYGVPEQGAVPGPALGDPVGLPSPPPGVMPPTAPPEPSGTTPLGREYSVDTTGGTVVKRVSEFTRHKCGVNPPDFKRSILVGPHGVEGCEVVRRQFNFRVTRQAQGLSPDYFRTVYALTGTVNNAPFLGFAGDSNGQSELLFQGMSGTGRDDGVWNLTYTFVASPNRVEELIDGDGTRAIGGHDYIWYRFTSTTSNGVEVLTPVHAYVERVYKPGDFSLLGIYS